MKFLKEALVTAMLIGATSGVAAFDHHGKDKDNQDPLKRAEMQCEKARKVAEEGSVEDKKEADQKCLKAYQKARELTAKHEKEKEKAKSKADKAKAKAKSKSKEKDDDHK